MRALLALVKKDMQYLLNDKIALAFTFAMPMVMIILFGFIFGGMGGDMDPITIIGIDNSHTALSKKIMRTLDTTSTLRVLHTFRGRGSPPGQDIAFTDSIAVQWITDGRVTAAFIIPADAITDTSSGLKLRLLYDARNQLETGMLQGILQQTIMTKTPGMFTTLMQHSTDKYLGKSAGSEFTGKLNALVQQYYIPRTARERLNRQASGVDSAASDSAEAGASKFFSSLVRFDQQQIVGATVTNPMVTRSIGGWALMFVLFSLTAASRSIISESEGGTLHRLLTAPIPRNTILLSKFLYAWLLGIVQLMILFFFASMIFSVNIIANFGNLLIMILLSSAAATAFGMLLAAYARTSAQANGISIIAILCMSALGGSWFPVSLMPPFIQTLSKFTLTYWSVEGFLTVLYRNLGIAHYLPNIIVLGGLTIILTAASVWRFRSRETW